MTWSPPRPVGRPRWCPADLHPIDVDDLEWRYVDDDGTVHSLGHRPLVERPRRRGRPDAGFLGRVGAYPVCPRGHELPRAYPGSPCLTVALVGPELSMKSHWIATTMREVVDQRALEFVSPHLQVEWEATPATRALLDGTYFRTHEKGTVLTRTRGVEPGVGPVRSPIVLAASVTDSRVLRRRSTSTSHVLVFDAPGEELVRSERARSLYAPYIAAADVVIFFIDVLQVPSLRDGLRAVVPEEVMRDYEGTSFSPTVISSCATWICQYLDVSFVTAPRTALAVLAKADLLPEAESSLLDRLGPERRQAASLSPAARSALARSVIDAAADGIGAALDASFQEVRYHLASAIGGQPPADGTITDPHGWGCVDVFRDAVLAAGLGRR